MLGWRGVVSPLSSCAWPWQGCSCTISEGFSCERNCYNCLDCRTTIHVKRVYVQRVWRHRNMQGYVRPGFERVASFSMINTLEVFWVQRLHVNWSERNESQNLPHRKGQTKP